MREHHPRRDHRRARVSWLATALVLTTLLGPRSHAEPGPAPSGDAQDGAAKRGPVAADAGPARGKRKEKGRGTGKGEGKGTRKAKGTALARRPTRSGGTGPVVSLVRSGFHVTDGGSEIVIQTAGEVDLESGGSPASPTFVLRRCRAVRANDRRPLDTRFFGTVVTAVALRQRGPDLIVRVSLKDAKTTATTRKERGPGDTWSWIVTFAPSAPGDSRPASPSSSHHPLGPTATAAVLR